MPDDLNQPVPNPTEPNAARTKPKTDWSQLLPTVFCGVIAFAIFGEVTHGNN
jgi:hypothetical protein